MANRNEEQLIIDVIDKASADLKKIQNQLSSIDKGLGNTSKATDNAGTSFIGMAKSAAGIFGIGLAVSTIKDQMMQASAEAVKYDAALLGLARVSSAFGQNQTEAMEAAKRLSSDGLLPLTESSAGLKNLLASGFELPEAIKLMEGFKDSASFNRLGTLEFGDAIVTTTQGIKAGNSMLSENAGITKNLSKILVEAGYAETDLQNVQSDLNVRMALYNGLLRETSIFSGDAAAMADTFQGKQQLLNTTITNARVELGHAVQYGLSPFYDAVINILTPQKQMNDQTEDGAKKAGFWQSAFYVAGQAGAGFLYTIKSLIDGTSLLASAAGLNASGFAMAYKTAFGNVGKLFENFGGKLSDLAAGTVSFFKGDWGAVGQKLGDAWNGSIFENFESFDWQSLQGQVDGLTGKFGLFTQDIKNSRDAFGKMYDAVIHGAPAMANALDGAGGGGTVDRSPFVDKSKSKEKAEKSAQEFINAFRGISDKAGDYLKKFRDKSDEIKEKFAETVKDINKKRKELMEGFRSDFGDAVVDIQNNMKDLSKSILATASDFDAQMAGVIITSQDKLAELQKNLQNELSLGSLDQDTSYIASLNEQIAAEEAFLGKHADTVTAVNDDITEQRRQAGLDNIEKLKEEKDAAVSELQVQVDAEQAILDAHKADIIKYHDDITEAARRSSRDQLTILKEQVAEEKAVLKGDLKNAKKDKKADFKANRKDLRANFADLVEMLQEKTGDAARNYGTLPGEGVAPFNSAISDVNKVGKRINKFKQGGNVYNFNINGVEGESLDEIASRFGLVLKTAI